MRDIVDVYLKNVAAHAIEDALACLAPDFELEFAGAGFALTKSQTATALEWDVGANGSLEWHFAEESSSSVTVVGSEGNDFLDLVGVGRLAFRSIYTIASTGLISRQLHDVTWGEVSLPEAMAPLIEWASEYELEELNEIYPAGQMSYSGPMATRWVRLAQKWKADKSA